MSKCENCFFVLLLTQSLCYILYNGGMAILSRPIETHTQFSLKWLKDEWGNLSKHAFVNTLWPSRCCCISERIFLKSCNEVVPKKMRKLSHFLEKTFVHPEHLENPEHPECLTHLRIIWNNRNKFLAFFQASKYLKERFKLAGKGGPHTKKR